MLKIFSLLVCGTSALNLSALVMQPLGSVAPSRPPVMTVPHGMKFKPLSKPLSPMPPPLSPMPPAKTAPLPPKPNRLAGVGTVTKNIFDGIGGVGGIANLVALLGQTETTKGFMENRILGTNKSGVTMTHLSDMAGIVSAQQQFAQNNLANQHQTPEEFQTRINLLAQQAEQQRVRQSALHDMKLQQALLAQQAKINAEQLQHVQNGSVPVLGNQGQFLMNPAAFSMEQGHAGVDQAKLLQQLQHQQQQQQQLQQLQQQQFQQQQFQQPQLQQPQRQQQQLLQQQQLQQQLLQQQLLKQQQEHQVSQESRLQPGMQGGLQQPGMPQQPEMQDLLRQAQPGMQGGQQQQIGQQQQRQVLERGLFEQQPQQAAPQGGLFREKPQQAAPQGRPTPQELSELSSIYPGLTEQELVTKYQEFLRQEREEQMMQPDWRQERQGQIMQPVC